MHHVLISIPCQNHQHARGVKRAMDFALAGLFYRNEVGQLLSSEIVMSKEQERARHARLRVDHRKQLSLVPKPSKDGGV